MYRSLAFGMAVLLPTVALADNSGQVTLDLDRWQRLQAEIAKLKKPTAPPEPFAFGKREVEGRFERGVLTATLRKSVRVFRKDVLVPLIGTDAAIQNIEVDGQAAVAQRDGGFYTVRLPQPGLHEIKVRFAIGREQARFSRAFRVGVPAAPITSFAIELPEKDLDVTVPGGLILGQSPTAGGTRVRGSAGGRTDLSMSWRRRTATQNTQRELEVEALTLLRPSDELLRATTTLHCRLVSGETDRLVFEVPPSLEVTKVLGDAVLQWYSTAQGGATQVVVLFRHLVDDQVRLALELQMPIGSDRTARVILPTPVKAALRGGFVAVEGRSGFDVGVKRAKDASPLDAREVPPELLDSTSRPILHAFRHEAKWPQLALTIRRNQEIDLTQAIIDDIQASSVIVEKGLEVAKMRMYVRNNTRHHLRLQLPRDAELTHALINGDPFLPATTHTEGNEVILIPLPQSEKIDGQRTHVVTDGETLSEIAQTYYGRPNAWRGIVAANHLYGPHDIGVGQQLSIPSKAEGVAFEESNFVLELAYKRKTDKLARWGAKGISLPTMDIPVMSATWHVYLPRAFEPLTFDGNLQQLSNIRYDLFRRFDNLLSSVDGVPSAYAGGGGYVDILSSRKAIYRRERSRKVAEVMAEFPLIGRRYRFRRVLLGTAPAQLSMVYVHRGVLPKIRWAVFALAVILSFLAARSRGPLRWGLFALVGAMGFGAGHYVLGVHRATLLGLDLGLILHLAPKLLKRIRPPKLAWPSLRGVAKLFAGILVILTMSAFPRLWAIIALFPLAYTALVKKRAEEVHNV